MSDFGAKSVILINTLFMDDLLFDPELHQVFVEAEKTKEEDLIQIKQLIKNLSS